jgi:O2-independent ubiquinone biosynthesis protein UbiV
MKLALGPVQYYWRRDTLARFYDEVATSAIDVVYLGEVVCSRRHEMKLADWLEVAGKLRAAGKEVVLSTQVLLESVSDVGAMQKVASNGDFTVEANDMGAVRSLAKKGPFVAGPHLNLYNVDALEIVAQAGASRWVAPIEMTRDNLRAMQESMPANIETEIFAFGRLPLAYSARCFTARHHNLPKDDCAFKCIDDPDGLLLRTREGEPFLVINGTQTQSARVHSLLHEYDELQSAGVDVLRLSPLSASMAAVIHLFDMVRRGDIAPAAANESLRGLLPALDCNGYWFGRPGLERVQDAIA